MMCLIGGRVDLPEGLRGVIVRKECSLSAMTVGI